MARESFDSSEDVSTTVARADNMATNTLTEFPDLADDEYVLLGRRLSSVSEWAEVGVFSDSEKLREYKNEMEEKFTDVQWLHSVVKENPTVDES